MAKVIKTVNHHLAEAYDLVIADLFSSLKKLKSPGEIKLGNLGTLVKTQQKLRSSLNGKTYLFYRIVFKASRMLKKELDK